MENTPQNRGGLLGHIYDMALIASDDNEWNQPVEQKNIRSRSTTLKGQAGDMLRVELEARKVQQDLGTQCLKTFYTLRAVHTEGGLVLDILPPHVLEALRKQKVAVGDTDDEQETVVLRFDDSDPEDDDEYEFQGYEDMDFRHVRSLDFVLDENGDVLYSARHDFYEEDGEGGVEIVGLHSHHTGEAIDEEFQTLSLYGWGNNATSVDPSELLAHPDLQTIEFKRGTEELGADLSFLEIVQAYVSDKNLSKHSEKDRRKSMLTMVAFLNYKKSSKDIEDLL
jgi:hypothetical protein